MGQAYNAKIWVRRQRLDQRRASSPKAPPCWVRLGWTRGAGLTSGLDAARQRVPPQAVRWRCRRGQVARSASGAERDFARPDAAAHKFARTQWGPPGRAGDPATAEKMTELFGIPGRVRRHGRAAATERRKAQVSQSTAKRSRGREGRRCRAGPSRRRSVVVNDQRIAGWMPDRNRRFDMWCQRPTPRRARVSGAADRDDRAPSEGRSAAR